MWALSSGRRPATLARAVLTCKLVSHVHDNAPLTIAVSAPREPRHLIGMQGTDEEVL